MKRFNYYLGLLLILVFATSCHEEFDQPPLYVPVADAVPNMTIAEFKEKHWQETTNYVDTVTDDEVIHGWVTANDISNNIYKTIYISDGSAGLSISVSQNELYKKYRVGQEIVLPMKGHYVGKATGQMYIAAPYNYINKNSGAITLECLNMSSKELDSLVQFNQWPDLSKVDTVDVEIGDFVGNFDAETQKKYQGLLVRIRDVEFVEADGKAPYADAGSNNTNRTLKDRDGKTLTVRNSRSSDFSENPLPSGRYDIVGVLGFYQIADNSTPTWQLFLRTADDVIGEGKKGTKSLPYSVADVIELQNTGINDWVEGYIVGAVGPEVTTVTSNGDIEWKAPTTLENTIVIADDPECKDYTKCVIVPLPQGSNFRSEVNLKNHVNAYKTAVKVKGEFTNYMGVAGIETSGAKNDYVLSFGFTELEESFANGLADGWTEIRVSGNKGWYRDSKADGLSVSGYNGTAPFDVWYISPALDIKNAASKAFEFMSRVRSYGGKTSSLEVYILSSIDLDDAVVKEKLDVVLPKAPNSTGTWSAWMNSGEIDLTPWSDGNYHIGFRYHASVDEGNNYDTWSIQNVKFGKGEPAPADNRADFESMGNKLGEWGTFTSDKGWKATNCMLLKGGSSDNNPQFKFIGLVPGSTSTYAYAPTLNGNTSSVGKIVSPVLKGVMKKLNFNYGYAFSGKVIRFRVDVKQNGTVIKSWEVSQENVTKYTVFTFGENLLVNGDFTIEFTNLCPSNAASEKDRLSIWNVEWDQ